MFKIETYNTLQGYNFQPSFFNLGFNKICFASYKDKASYDTCLNLFPVEFSVPILTICSEGPRTRECQDVENL